MSDDRFRIDPRTQLPPSIFDQPPRPAPQPGDRGGSVIAPPRDTVERHAAGRGHAAANGHHPDDLPREVAHALHTAHDACEKAKGKYDQIRANPTPRALQHAVRELDAGARKLNGAIARLEILAATGNPKAAAALPAARARLSVVNQALQQGQQGLAALGQHPIKTRHQAVVRESLDRIERTPKQPAAAVATGQPPATGRVGRVVEKAHGFASRPGPRALGRIGFVAGAALDAYQGWRETSGKHPYWRVRTAVSYTIAGAAVGRNPGLAIPDLFSGGRISDHFKRIALMALSAEEAVLGGTTKPLEDLVDRVNRGEHGRDFRVLSKAGYRLIP